MASEVFTFSASVWEHQGSASWFFISLPEEIADDIEQQYGHRAAGFGSVRVEVTVGDTTWQTSLFPDDKRGTYVLPVKKAIRRAEGLDEGTVAEFRLRVIIDDQTSGR
ncbi:MAG: DUF1905 domain-containing protein [Ilumatobacteraceae bacterium]